MTSTKEVADMIGSQSRTCMSAKLAAITQIEQWQMLILLLQIFSLKVDSTAQARIGADSTVNW